MTLEDLILFVDGEAIVIDKPAGLPVDAPRAGGNSVEARIEEWSLGFQRPPVPVHRLDALKETLFQGGPLRALDLAWPAAYGLACVAAALIVVWRRPMGR